MTTVPQTTQEVGSNAWLARLGALATYAGWVFASYICSSLLWVALPALIWGWQPLVVVSGSMAPLIRPGDLVLVDDLQKNVGSGSVVAFWSATDEVVLHRVVGYEPDGSYRTRGDANDQPDSDPVQLDDVIGRGRLLVPFAGLPRTWGLGWQIAAGGLTLAAAWSWRDRRAWAIALLAAGLSMGGVAAASASFTDTTASSGSSLSMVTVAPATNLTAGCGPVGASTVDVNLTWTGSITVGITGYDILHDAPGGGTSFSTVGSVSGSQTSFTHSVPVAVLGLGTHTYVVRTALGPWNSVDSNTDAVSITHLVVFVCSAL